MLISFPAGLGTCPHCQRYQKLVQWPWCYCPWLASKLFHDILIYWDAPVIILFIYYYLLSTRLLFAVFGYVWFLFFIFSIVLIYVISLQWLSNGKIAFFHFNDFYSHCLERYEIEGTALEPLSPAVPHSLRQVY